MLHYLGSCVLKMLKTKFIMGRKKKQGSKRCQSQVTIVHKPDEDPFLASMRRTSKPFPSNEINNEGMATFAYLVLKC